VKGRGKDTLFNEKLTEHFVTFVEILFAVVLGSSIWELRSYLFHPDWQNPSFWALVSVYLTAVTSWIGWHKSTTKYPYTNSRAGYVRSIFDAFIVATYVALLFFGSNVSFVASEGRQSLGFYLWGFVVVFVLYYFSGVVRKAEYGEEASKTRLIIKHGAFLLLGSIVYMIVSEILSGNYSWLLWLFVSLPLVVMVIYRWEREWHDLPWIVNRQIQVAVDMDGVLVEQVIPVLEKLKQEKKIEMNKSMITDWEYPISGTNIKIEIEKAERQEEFVRRMPPVEGAIDGIKILSNKFKIVIATSRELITDSWSKDWLEHNRIPYDIFVNTRSAGKTLTGIDILIDDYIGNVEQFIRNGDENRRAILFAQPWNQDITEIADLIEEGKVQIAHSWSAVLSLLQCRPREV
jgi:5'(3')-deoxyribonucleotidase